MITEVLVAVVFILGITLLLVKYKGKKVFDYITILALPFLMSYLFINMGEINTTAYLLIILFTGGFVYQAVKFYNKYLKNNTRADA